MIVTSASDDQRLNPIPLARAGVAVPVSRHELGSMVGPIVESLLADADRRTAMSLAGRALVDGRGSARAANSLLSLVQRSEVVRARG